MQTLAQHKTLNQSRLKRRRKGIFTSLRAWWLRNTLRDYQHMIASGHREIAEIEHGLHTLRIKREQAMQKLQAIESC